MDFRQLAARTHGSRRFRSDPDAGLQPATRMAKLVTLLALLLALSSRRCSAQDPGDATLLPKTVPARQRIQNQVDAAKREALNRAVSGEFDHADADHNGVESEKKGREGLRTHTHHIIHQTRGT